METKEEIQAKYKTLHDELSHAYYTGTSGLTKEEFDTQHAQIWKDMEAELIATGHIVIEPPDPDTVRAEEILATSAAVITMPEVWELLRIIGRRLDYNF